MARFSIHLNDAGITLLNNEQITYREPGYALLNEQQLTTGNKAFAQARIVPRQIQHRFWSELATESLVDKNFSHLSAAELVSRQLEQLWQLAGSGASELTVAVPPSLDSQQLGLFLGIASELNIPIVSLVDSAAAATRREYKNAVPVHIDMGLHSTVLTRLTQHGAAQVERTEILDSCGVYSLQDAWLHAVAEAFVQQSRFDPLHTAETEQMLLDRLSGWLSEATQRESVEMQIESGSVTYNANLESLVFVGTAAPIYQQIANKLQTLYRAEDIPAIQVTDRVARMPGLTEMLKARVGGEVFVLEAGATARGALTRFRSSAGTAGVSLIRQMPWDQSAVEFDQEVGEKGAVGVPTHLLHGSVAYAIGNLPLVLGSQSDESEQYVALTADMPGISRRHCSMQRKNGQCVLEDHSRYGTFLNGHRIDGSSVLRVGDVLRVGSPGFEFQLITTIVDSE